MSGARGGEPYAIDARIVVLAAGALENARLLLASDSTRPCGLGNEHGLVGRFFAEHPHALVGKMLCPHNDRSLKLYQWVNDIQRGQARRSARRSGAERRRLAKARSCSA